VGVERNMLTAVTVTRAAYGHRTNWHRLYLTSRQQKHVCRFYARFKLQ